MKKRILTLILSIIVFISIPTAIAGAYYNLPIDVGNFNDYGGGGDWGGGDYGGGDYGGNDYGGNDYGYDYGDNYTTTYSDHSDNSDDNPVVLTIAIIVVIVLVIVQTLVKHLKGVNHTKTHTPTRTQSYSSRETPQQFMPLDFTAKITETIRQSDPDFSADKFIAWSKNIFITLQNAWTARDWEKIRVLEKEELFEQHNMQIQEYIRLGRINVIERINVNQAFLHKYVRDENYEHLTVCMKTRMVDYIIDEKTGSVIKGDANADVYMTYLLTFIRRKGIKTSIINGVISSSCPHCGAPVDSASAGKCEYCGSVIHTGEFNWVLSDMQAVKPGFQNDDRGIVILDNDKNN